MSSNYGPARCFWIPGRSAGRHRRGMQRRRPAVAHLPARDRTFPKIFKALVLEISFPRSPKIKWGRHLTRGPEHFQRPASHVPIELPHASLSKLSTSGCGFSSRVNWKWPTLIVGASRWLKSMASWREIVALSQVMSRQIGVSMHLWC